MNISEVEGIGPQNAEKLAGAGVTTTDDLLERGATSSGRSSLELATGIPGTLILEWVNHVDLMRIDGVGSEYADLLEAAGVDSPAELAQRNPANLATTLLELDAARPDVVRRVPSEEAVRGWIEQAKSLDRAVFHGGGSTDAAPAAAAPAAAAPAAAAPTPARPVGAPSAVAAPSLVAAPTPPEPVGLWARIKALFGR